MTPAGRAPVAASLAAALTRTLLRCYPRAFRKEVGDAVLGDVRRRARELAAARGPVAAGAWLVPLGFSLVTNGLAAWAERLVPPRTAFSWLDLKLALRMLIKYPGLSLTGGLGIAVAIALGVAFVSFSEWQLHPTIPLHEGDRLVGLENWDRRTSREERRSLYDFGVWRASLTSVEDLSAFHTVDRNIIAGGAIEAVRVAAMTPSGFRLARVPPLLGRTLLDADAAPGAPAVAVIGFDVWRTKFAATPDIIGRDLRLGADPHTIVGVMPEGFAFPVNHRIWTPLKLDPSGVKPGEGPSIYISGRLAPGVDLAAAQAEIEIVGNRLTAELPDSHGHLRPEVLPYAYPFEGMGRTSGDDTVAILVIFSLLVVVVCVNVGILVYARTTTRHGEIAVRSALGASRGRIVTQMFAESLVLCAIAAGAAVCFVAMLLGWLERAHRSPPFWTDYRLSASALAYAAAVTVLAAVITGVMPALRATGRRMPWTLQQVGSRSGLRLGRTWTTLIVVQVAVAVAAVPIAAALSWSQIRGEFNTPAFPVDQFIVAGVGLDQHAGGGEGAALRFGRLRTALSRQLESEGVAGHAFSLALPASGRSARVELEHDAAPSSRAARREAIRGTIDRRFFATFGVPLLAGRAFEPRDFAPGADDVVIVNRAFAAQRLPDGSPLGRRVRYPQPGGSAPIDPESQRWYEVIGVVDNFDANPFHESLTQPRVYHPLRDTGTLRAYLTVRMAAIPPGAAERLREVTARADPALVVDEVMTLEEIHRLYRSGIVTVTAAVGVGLSSVLLLSAAGIYALMSFTVTQRRREIAIRTALGAEPGRLLAGIFRHALRQIGTGVAFGVGIALLLDLIERGEALQGYRMSLLPGMIVVMSLVGLLAALGPARRGLRIAPQEALKAE